MGCRFSLGGKARLGDRPCGRHFLPGLILLFSACSAPFSESELAARIEKCSPQWQGYQEDIKGQVGAGPVAEWRGEPVKAVQQDSKLMITFRLSGAWASRDGAIPVLTQDSLGRVRQSTSATHDQGLTTYDFSLDLSGSASLLPWVEVKFPNGDKRIVFDQKGVWNAL